MIAYFDCFAGISGNMILGAFIDLGVPLDFINQTLKDALNIQDFNITASKVSVNHIAATYANVTTSEKGIARDYKAIKSIINKSSLSGRAKKISLDIFKKIAKAESYIHDIPENKIHFHELGAIDAIADITGTALCLEYLKIDSVFVSHIPLCSGKIVCDHGTMPAPGPAVLEILKGADVFFADFFPFENVTPTGAAIASSIALSRDNMPDMTIEKIGYGAGTKRGDNWPNVLRIVLGKSGSYIKNNQLIMVETNIDDTSPELLGFVMEKLFAIGALDVCFIPIFMKKNRPATMLQALCTKDKREAVIECIFSETTSLGIRDYTVNRTSLDREHIKIDTNLGKIGAVCAKMADRSQKISPEYEDCKKIAIEKNIPLREVYRAVINGKDT